MLVVGLWKAGGEERRVVSRYSLRRSERWSSVAHDETHHCRSSLLTAAKDMTSEFKKRDRYIVMVGLVSQQRR